MLTEDYRPAHIEFDVAQDGTNMPLQLGEFETAEDASKFIGTNFIALNDAKTVSRHMDIVEKTELRKEVSTILEDQIPICERDLSDANNDFNRAKKRLQDTTEALNVTINKAKVLASEVKRGLKEIKLDELYTFRIAYRNRYYFFTYIDKALRLVSISEIPDDEKSEIWNQMAGNEEFIDKTFGDGTIDGKEFKQYPNF